MSKEFIKKLQYSYEGQPDSCTLPLVLIDSFKLISDFFARNNSNKLCLVFPTKEYAAQWLSLNLALDHLTEEFRGNKQEIFEAYKHFKRGQKLLLNNKAVVEWIKGDEDEIMFKTKGSISKTNPWEDTGGDVITLNTSRIDSLKPAPASRKVLSARKAVYENLSPKSDYPVDTLLNISSKGNFVFLKKPVCLVSKIKNVEFSLGNIYLNKMPLSDFFRTEKIGDSGALITNCPLLIAGNLLHLTLYTIANPVSKIVIDGFSAIQERISDFSDIDAKGIPTILVTDLSEVGNFEQISNFGFDFFNFTKEQFLLEEVAPQSPFYLLNKKLKNYASFRILKEICEHAGLEDLICKIQSIEMDESNNGLSMLKVLLIQLANRISAIVHELTDEEIADLIDVLTETEEMFLQNKNWLGDAQLSIRESILLLKSVIDGIKSAPSDKCRRMLFLLKQKRYDYIICPTEREALAVKQFIGRQLLAYKPKVITAASINDSIISENLGCAMLTGWAKSGNVNRLLSSFFFTEITVLFYRFENRYLNSLQRRNQKQSNSIKATIDNKGSCLENGTVERNGFNSFYTNNEIIDPPGGELDIIKFELELDNAQYSRYAVNRSMAESVKAKRADFENDYFIYTTESHKFHVINELIEKQRKRPTLYTKRIDSIVPGDVIALINADRDILANWVEQHTKPEDLSYVNQWIQLWKSLIKDYYASVGNDFKELVLGLRECHCVKHEATIRTWLQDESRIGPDDDADLISIAMLTGSELLHDNINNVRDAISTMKGWRMKASDYIIDRIKDKLHRLTDYTAIGMKFPVENLGSVNILKVTEIQNDWESIDARYANRLLQKETI